MKLLGNKRLIILMLGLICFIALMGFTFGNRGYGTWPEKFLKDTVSFTQSLIYKPIAYVTDFFGEIGRLRNAYEENKVLRHTLTKYARDTARLNDYEMQNQRLELALKFTERQKNNGYNYRIAEVVSFEQSRKSVTINLGQKDGIHDNMAVISVEGGLLGRIVGVSAFYSEVQLLTGINDRAAIDDDKKSIITSKAISATVKGKEGQSFGIIERYDPEIKKNLIMTMIEPEDPLQVGDTVMTAGKGLVFPSGIEIGKVVERYVGDYGIKNVAVVQPFASFNNIREVFVVEAPQQEGAGG